MKWLYLILACLFMAGCEKAVFEEENDGGTKGGNVVLSVTGYEGLKGTVRSTEDLTKVCTRMNFVVYRDGERLKTINQKLGDKDFGSVELSLEEGDYEVLILGHSSPGKENPKTSNPEEIEFKNITESGGTGYSDTFYTFEYITVGDKPISRTFTLTRAVAMFRLVTTDGKPSEVKKMRFLYTGGSRAFNAYTGYGYINSTQVVFFDLTEEQDGQPLQFDLYTFPHDEASVLKKVQVTAYDSKGEAIFNYERTFENVPIERNTITQYSGAFFTEMAYEDPEEPDTPVNPEDPENPDSPDVPDNPSTPEEPEKTDTPSTIFKVETDWASINYFTF